MVSLPGHETVTTAPQLQRGGELKLFKAKSLNGYSACVAPKWPWKRVVGIVLLNLNLFNTHQPVKSP